MKLEEKFVVSRARKEIESLLDDDETFARLFPDTSVTKTGDSVRETCTQFKALGQEREVRFVFESLPDGSVKFAKICDGNVWRSLEGEVRLEETDAEHTRVWLRMDGTTRTFVPELTIRGPMRDQIGQMAKSLRRRLEEH